MKLDKRHMAIALTLLVGSIVYNVWVFTRPSSRPRTASESMTEPIGGDALPFGPTVVGEGAAPPVDPLLLPPAADVGLDRLPAWPRNPFASMRRVPESTVIDAEPATEIAAEPDVVVNSVLYSATRKLAMVNGRTVRVGDHVGTVTIVDILPNAVVIASATRGVRTVERRTPVARAVRK